MTKLRARKTLKSEFQYLSVLFHVKMIFLFRLQDQLDKADKQTEESDVIIMNNDALDEDHESVTNKPETNGNTKSFRRKNSGCGDCDISVHTKRELRVRHSFKI